MIKEILIGPAYVILLMLIAAAFQPDEFRVECSATIAASPAMLFPQVNDPKLFEVWDPWQALDLEVKNTYSGPASGVATNSKSGPPI